ncbi:MAG: hypothetical protein LBF22_09305 [Deltaproteobacteria bacterium]|nr:hypothetical protein [Deltaproteobacteria bacterium]
MASFDLSPLTAHLSRITFFLDQRLLPDRFAPKGGSRESFQGKGSALHLIKLSNLQTAGSGSAGLTRRKRP